MNTVRLLASCSCILLLVSCGQSAAPPDGGEYGPPMTGSSVQTGAESATGNSARQQGAVSSDTYVVSMTKDGFSPSKLTVDVGDTVRFVNMDAVPRWPASDVHPTHRSYPGSGIEKCSTAERSDIFDACKGLGQGETFSFVFKSKGTWAFHDHLHPKDIGSVTVSEASAEESRGSVRTETLAYFANQPKYVGYLATPQDSGKHPALILIHEWWGLNDNIKKLARDFAAKGYVVLAVDLYGEPATTDQPTAMRLA